MNLKPGDRIFDYEARVDRLEKHTLWLAALIGFCLGVAAGLALSFAFL